MIAGHDQAPMPRGRYSDPSLLQALSLYLMLLAFFVLLFNLSKVDRFRTDAVSESLNSTFASRGRPTTLPHALSSLEGELIELRAFSRSIGHLVKRAIPAVQFDVREDGRLMAATFPIDEVYEPGGATLRIAMVDLAADLAEAFARAPSGLRFGVEAVVLVRAPLPAVPPAGPLPIAVSRAGRLGAALAEYPSIAHDLAAGVRHARSEAVRLSFRLRPSREAPLELGPAPGGAGR